MKYTLTLTEDNIAALLNIVKNDFEYAYNDGNDSHVEDMQDDIDLLKAIAASFNDENAKLKLQIIIAGYEQNLRTVL